MSDTELVSVAGTENPLAHLPKAMQERILKAQKSIQESSNLAVNRVTFSATDYKLPDGTKTDSFVAVVVAVKHANVHYPSAYSRDDITPPDCVALCPKGQDASCADLVPADFVEAKYAERCADCRNFEFGSAAQGKGKACFEHTLMALYIPSIGEDLVVLEARKGNSRTADNYIRSVTNKAGHPIAVLTRFTIGAKKEWEQHYELDGMVAPDLVANLAERMDDAEELLYHRIADSYKPAPVPGEKKAEDKTSGRSSRKRG